jgi:hypothetical protein
MLQPGRNPWDFEMRGIEEHMNDGKLIFGLASADDPPVPYLNIYSKGKVNWSKLDRLDAESRDELVGRGWMGPHWNGWEGTVSNLWPALWDRTWLLTFPRTPVA